MTCKDFIPKCPVPSVWKVCVFKHPSTKGKFNTYRATFRIKNYGLTEGSLYGLSTNLFFCNPVEPQTYTYSDDSFRQVTFTGRYEYFDLIENNEFFSDTFCLFVMFYTNQNGLQKVDLTTARPNTFLRLTYNCAINPEADATIDYYRSISNAELISLEKIEGDEIEDSCHPFAQMPDFEQEYPVNSKKAYLEVQRYIDSGNKKCVKVFLVAPYGVQNDYLVPRVLFDVCNENNFPCQIYPRVFVDCGCEEKCPEGTYYEYPNDDSICCYGKDGKIIKRIKRDKDCPIPYYEYNDDHLPDVDFEVVCKSQYGISEPDCVEIERVIEEEGELDSNYKSLLRYYVGQNL